ETKPSGGSSSVTAGCYRPPPSAFATCLDPRTLSDTGLLIDGVHRADPVGRKREEKLRPFGKPNGRSIRLYLCHGDGPRGGPDRVGPVSLVRERRSVRPHAFACSSVSRRARMRGERLMKIVSC